MGVSTEERGPKGKRAGGVETSIKYVGPATNKGGVIRNDAPNSRKERLEIAHEKKGAKSETETRAIERRTI